MSDRSRIEWTDASWNPIQAINGGWTCAKISPGCTHCYAERLSQRVGGRPYGHDGPCLNRQILHTPLHWRQPKHIFTCSMTDLFWDRIPVEWITQIFNIMTSATLECRRRHDHKDECWTGPSHTFTILTKRAQRMHRVLTIELPEYVGEHWPGDTPLSIALSVNWPLRNVRIGISCEDQRRLDERLPWLLRTPAAARVLCLEPILGPLDLTSALRQSCSDCGSSKIDCLAAQRQSFWACCPHCRHRPIDWVIIGGESGPKARPCQIEWIRAIVKQCVDAGVPIFVKQDSAFRPGQQGRIPNDLWIHQWPAP